MDIQFILDVYSCVKYVIEYVGNIQRGISKLMRGIVEGFKSTTDITVQDQLWKIASTFSTSQEISAQEAVYTCLGIKQSSTSTGHVFVNTSHPDKRTRIIKPAALRGQMDVESTDIFCDGLIEYYSCRPLQFEELTLAEFAVDYEIRNKQKVPIKSRDSDNLSGEDVDEE